MIDRRGYRLNVGIILANNDGKLFWGRRPGYKDAWQFPQGGVGNYETLQETLFRELHEEIGLEKNDVKILGITNRWLYYQLPYHMRRHHQRPVCIGQKQKWFLLKLISDENKIRFDQTASPEFSDWQWVDYWYPLGKVISFKRGVYQRALRELKPLLRSVHNA